MNLVLDIQLKDKNREWAKIGFFVLFYGNILFIIIFDEMLLGCFFFLVFLSRFQTDTFGSLKAEVGNL